MNPLLANAEVDNFLSGFPSTSRRRGKHYFADGAVLSVECFVPGREYGAVVRGSEDYEVAYDMIRTRAPGNHSALATPWTIASTRLLECSLCKRTR